MLVYYIHVKIQVLTNILLFLVYIFSPNSEDVVYKQEKIFGKSNENTSILWTIFAPKSDHQNEQNSSWLDNSSLYILTNQQVIIIYILYLKNK